MIFKMICDRRENWTVTWNRVASNKTRYQDLMRWIQTKSMQHLCISKHCTRFCCWLCFLSTPAQTLSPVPHPPFWRLEVDTFIFSPAALCFYFAVYVFAEAIWIPLSSCKYPVHHNHSGHCLVWSIYCSVCVLIPIIPVFVLIKCVADLKCQWTQGAGQTSSCGKG